MAERCRGPRGRTAASAAETHGAVPGTPLLPTLAHLEPVHQLQGLAVVLVGFEDDIGQFVDNDIQGALLLNWPAKVQLQGGDRKRRTSAPKSTAPPLSPPSACPRSTKMGQENWHPREVNGASGMNPSRSQNSTRSGPAYVFLSPSPMLPRVQKICTRNQGDKEPTGQASITVKLLYRKCSY